jgi:hypothetical protein
VIASQGFFEFFQHGITMFLGLHVDKITDLLAVPLRNAELRQGVQSRHKVMVVIGSKVEPESLLTGQ